ncbi:hypothetical protein M378DRAFT_874906 [Amanita muscaria Koide BX008]|uniref:Uncharacterized protein n=1 Tax=Amanita muscaria (strain Koide BX008) TaxID=946122 RepID=A0A0C2WXD1_AMAMK|nr:hypothetical protein M378DRAFT_874906 [Amanita muscaria Koide BX008]
MITLQVDFPSTFYVYTWVNLYPLERPFVAMTWQRLQLKSGTTQTPRVNCNCYRRKQLQFEQQDEEQVSPFVHSTILDMDHDEQNHQTIIKARINMRMLVPSTAIQTQAIIGQYNDRSTCNFGDTSSKVF